MNAALYRGREHSSNNKDFTEGVKEIKKMNSSMIERLTAHIMESEKAGREALVHGQIQMAHVFANVLKPTNH